VAPLVLPAAAFGVSFGVLAAAAGMGTLAPIVMSATTFAGAGQFAAASILDEGGAVVAAMAAAALLNSRYVPIGISVAPLFHGPRWRRLVEAQLIVDESWAISNRGGGRFDRGLLLGAGLVLYPCWVLSTTVGAVAGDLLGDPERLGLDAAFPALFLALLVPQLRTRLAVAAALGGAAVALALVPFAPAGLPIVAAAVVCLIGLRRS
jgi:4-azaleucine resistance transporter AzlC